jgi:hypothetical protein
MYFINYFLQQTPAVQQKQQTSKKVAQAKDDDDEVFGFAKIESILYGKKGRFGYFAVLHRAIWQEGDFINK